MVMPFSNPVAQSNYEHSIKPICQEFNLVIRRADEIFNVSPIYEDIVKEIQDASIVIADTTSRNSNVFYELGIAHTLKQNRTIIITQDEFNEMPFDIAHFRIIYYENSIEGKTKFEEALRKTLKALLSDYRETFKDEFSMVIEIFSSSDKNDSIIALHGTSQYKGILNRNEICDYKGVHPKGSCRGSSILDVILKPFERMGYIRFENDIVSFTEKGKAFVEVIVMRRFKCEFFKGQNFE